MTQTAALIELDGIAQSLLSGSGRLAGAINLARVIAARAAFLLPLFGGVDGLIAKAHALYDAHCAPYDIPGLEDDTEAAIDHAAKLMIRDIIKNAAAALS